MKSQVAPVKLGRAYVMNGRPYVVGLLNFSRARLDPLFRKRKEIVSRLHGYSKTIHTTPPSVSIAAGAVLETVTVEPRRRPKPQPVNPNQQTFRI